MNSTNYTITGESNLANATLETIGLTGFNSNGLGLVVQFDSRDNQYSPASGQVFKAHNLAYRKGLGGACRLCHWQR